MIFFYINNRVIRWSINIIRRLILLTLEISQCLDECMIVTYVEINICNYLLVTYHIKINKVGTFSTYLKVFTKLQIYTHNIII